MSGLHSFSQGLLNVRTKRQREALPRVGVLRDKNGTYTDVGKRDPVTGARRMWLAGASAARGY